MVEMKWQNLSEVDPKREYLAFSEMAERKSLWAYFNWLMRARKVAGQLKTAKGLVGFTARLGFWNRQVIMLAAFEDEKVLKEFAHGGQHAQCMEKTKPEAKDWKMDKWSITGSDVPLKIDDAIKRLQRKK